MLNQLFITSDVFSLLESFAKTLTKAEESELRNLLSVTSEKPRINFDDWWQILEKTQQFLNRPQLGLLIGESARPEHFGVLGYLLRTSSNLGQALQAFERFQRLLYGGNLARLENLKNDTGQDICRLIWQNDYGYSSQLSDELLFSALLKLIRNVLAQQEIRPSHISFTQKLNDVHAYKDYFGCEVEQEKEALYIDFPAEYFVIDNPHSDAYLHQLMDEKAQAMLSKTDLVENDFEYQVRRLLIKNLPEGDASARRVSRDLSISSRSLHRKLQEQGMLFKDLLADTRKTLVLKYFREDEFSLSEIALLLGYSEQSAFNRAFKAWFGMSPRQYLQQRETNTPT